ncbi:MAG: hypothetical protein AVDCRST_MAG03-2680 [uncultured Rubrobacteraceae bacterium]|uniref:Uncharacterized protein n=1 Tax=uncultured Rubrobacteraceae bacterium TaxID=349277 RepID=A0A6J4PSS4_9ACTN|nr:MAG: hypothetical protein AVDCRST_MAG03-2680 [uncultured Rubrobacteraceae bacterium]
MGYRIGPHGPFVLPARGGELTVKVDGLGWLGVRTERFEETARFFAR